MRVGKKDLLLAPNRSPHRAAPGIDGNSNKRKRWMATSVPKLYQEATLPNQGSTGSLELPVEESVDRINERSVKGEGGVIVIGVLDQDPMGIGGRPLVHGPAEVGGDDRVG